MSRRERRAANEKASRRPPARPVAKRLVPWFLVVVGAALAYGLAVVARNRGSGSRARTDGALVVPEPTTDRLEEPVVEILAASRKRVLDDPGSADAWGTYATVLDAHEFFRHAEVAYRRALELSPDDPRLCYNLAVVLDSLGSNPDEILELYGRLMRREPKYPAVHVRVGVVRARQGDLKAAVESYRHALALDPKLAIARRSLGQMLLALDDAESAVEEFERTAAEAPLDGPTQAVLAQALARLGEEERAAAAAARSRLLEESLILPDPVRFLVVKQGRSAKLAWDRALGRMGERNFAGAIEDLKIVERTKPRNPNVHACLADAYQGMGNTVLAEQHREEASKLQRR